MENDGLGAGADQSNAPVAPDGVPAIEVPKPVGEGAMESTLGGDQAASTSRQPSASTAAGPSNQPPAGEEMEEVYGHPSGLRGPPPGRSYMARQGQDGGWMIHEESSDARLSQRVDDAMKVLADRVKVRNFKHILSPNYEL